ILRPFFTSGSTKSISSSPSPTSTRTISPISSKVTSRCSMIRKRQKRSRRFANRSIRTRFQFEQQSATEFLMQILKARSDRAFVMGFDVTPTVTQDWTNNIDGLETGINRLRPGGGTAMFDAVYTACRDKLLTERGPEPVRKAMILISDGDDNQSRVHPDEAIKECQRAETIIYAISTNWTPSRGKG